MTIDQRETFVTQLPGGGYQLLEFSEQGKFVYSPRPILGFLVYEKIYQGGRKMFLTYPVTAELICDKFALMRPSGEVAHPDGIIFESFKDFEDWLKDPTDKQAAE